MSEFRLTQITDTHLARRLPTLTDNFDRVREYIDAKRPDLVINSGDIGFDGPTSRDDLEFAKELAPEGDIAVDREAVAVTDDQPIPVRIAKAPDTKDGAVIRRDVDHRTRRRVHGL